MMPGDGRETTSNHVQIATRMGFDNGIYSHLLVVYCKQVIIQFWPFQYLRIFLLIDQEESM